MYILDIDKPAPWRTDEYAFIIAPPFSFAKTATRANLEIGRRLDMLTNIFSKAIIIKSWSILMTYRGEIIAVNVTAKTDADFMAAVAYNTGLPNGGKVLLVAAPPVLKRWARHLQKADFDVVKDTFLLQEDLYPKKIWRV